MAKNLHRGPGPERAVLFEGEVPAAAGGGVLGPDLGAGAVLASTVRRSVCPAAVNMLSGGGGRAAAGSGGRVRAASTAAARTGRTGSRSLVRWSIRDLRRARSFLRDISSSRIGQGTAHAAPAGRVFGGPLGDVEVEGADGGQAVPAVVPRGHGFGDVPAGTSARTVLVVTRCFHAAASGAEAQRADPGMVGLRGHARTAGQRAGRCSASHGRSPAGVPPGSR